MEQVNPLGEIAQTDEQLAAEIRAELERLDLQRAYLIELLEQYE